MGAKISTIQGISPVIIKDNIMYIKDKLGVVHRGTININIDFEMDEEFYIDLYFVNIVKDGLRLVCRYDKTYSLYRSSTNELLDMGSFELEDDSILQTEYAPIGHYVAHGVVNTLVIDKVNKLLVHAITNGNIRAVRHFKFKLPFLYDVDLLRSNAEAHHGGVNMREEIYIYTQYGRLNTEGLLEEVK